MPKEVVRSLFLLCWLGFVLMTFPATAAPDVQEGALGQALDMRQGFLMTPGDPAYSTVPLTVECRVKILNTAQYNILIANETKASPTHWEIFTMPGDGTLHAYLPGRTPDHVHTAISLSDKQWHYVALVLEEKGVRLFVDGVEKGSIVAPLPTKPGVPGALAIGSLAEGGFGCNGLVDEVRISKGVQTLTESPKSEFEVNANCVGLWHFSTEAPGKDSSACGRDGKLQRKQVVITATGQEIPGGMPTELQPLPNPEDTTPLRAALKDVVKRLELKTIAVDSIQDAVLREWRYDFQWMGKKEYPEQRPGGDVDPEKLKREVFDPQALILEADGGPLGTVLRRTEALITNLTHASETLKSSPVIEDFKQLQDACSAKKITLDSPEYQAHYLAACALRRQIALSNSQLDFDAILCVARGTFEGSVRSNPSTADPQGGHFVTQYFGFNALPGGGLYIIRNYKIKPEIINVLADSVVQNGRLKGQKLDYGAFATPDLSYDGKTVVFAWTENKEHKWVYSKKTCFHLFRVNIDGSNLVQLTDGDVNDFDPCWLPNGRIAFVSERRGGYIRCFAAYLKVRNYTLFSMNDDGSDISPLSYFETSEWNPSVNNDGKIVYTRWDYVDRENCLGTRFWESNPDGTNPRAPHGNYPLPFNTFPDHTPWKIVNGRESDSRFGAPLVEMGIRSIPNSSRYIFTGAPHHGEAYGSLAMLDLRVPDDHHMSQIKRITPDEPFPETETPGRRHYKYGTPWPLSEDFYLCNVWENLALVDRYGNKEILCDLRSLPCPQDERLRIIEPIPLRARTKPPVIPSKIRQKPDDGTPNATISVMNVYNSDMEFPAGTKIKWLRVIQNILKTNHTMGEPMIGYERENTPRIPLGIVPVEEDGSVYFEAPVAKELIFQVLDENYMAVQSMRSAAFVHAGEQLTCLGCHENTLQSAQKDSVALAMRRAPSKLQPECGSIEPVSYYRQIKPIFDRSCVPCHTKEKKGPQDMSYEALREGYTFWFSGAMFTGMCAPEMGVHGGSRTMAGRFGARVSKIGQALLTEAHRKAVPEADRHQVIQWIDCNSLRLGSFIREAAQLKGELVWPCMDVDPENLQGIDGTQPGLKRNFWHENSGGPYPMLVTEHVHDRVVLLDESSKIIWEYNVPHPQDAWVLPNGNILTSYYQGVREVTRDKQIVWEYKTEKPNEIPNCQPLPDGNVMIGIVGECRLIEVNRKGEIVHQVQLATTEKTPHAQFRMCRKTPEGTYLVPFTAEGAVREYDRDGKVIRAFPSLPSPVCAIRLENGNTLISAGQAVTEYDRNNQVVWQLNEIDIPDIQLGILAGIHRLKNGNTIVCNWNTQDTGDKVGAHIFEVTDDKRVVWKLTGATLGQVAQCQLMGRVMEAPGLDGQ